MNYFTVRPNTTVGRMKRSYEEDQQRVFPVAGSDNVFEGLVYAGDLRNCDDSSTASQVLIEATKWDDRDIFVLATQPVTEAKDIIRRQKIQFVPVVDRNHRIVGTIDESA